MAHEWAAGAEHAQRAVLEDVERLPRRPSSIESVVGYGTDWAGAIEDIGRADGDLLAVWSSTADRSSACSSALAHRGSSGTRPSR